LRKSQNLKQQGETLKQLSPTQLVDAITWFKTLPVAFEVGGIRVTHASWQARDIDCIERALDGAGRFTPAFLTGAEDAGSELNLAIENILKGPELQLPSGLIILDKANHARTFARIKWYENGAGRTYREHHLGSDDVPDVSIDAGDLAKVETFASGDVP